MGKLCEAWARHVTIRRMRIAGWMPKATNTLTQNMYYLVLFHCNNGLRTYLIVALHYFTCIVRYGMAVIVMTDDMEWQEL